MIGKDLRSDEGFHYNHIERFSDGDFTILPLLTVIPGYHVFVMAVLAVFGRPTVIGARLVSAGLGFLCAIVLLGLCRKEGLMHPLLRSAQCFFIPIVFPFFFSSTRTSSRCSW